MNRRYHVINGIDITVEDHGGDGPPVVFVHGLGGSAGNWSMVAPAISDRAHAVALDLPGHGRSGPARCHDIATHVGAVARLIDHLDLGPATVVGNSMGGLVAELLADAWPESVRALVLVSPAAPPVELTPADRAVAVRLLVESLPGIGRGLLAWATSRMTAEQQVRETLDVVMAHPERLPEEGYRRAVTLARLRRTMPWSNRAFAESAISIRRTLMHRSVYEAMLARISVPVSLIFGSADRVVPPSALRRLATSHPDWRAIELPDVGHTAMLERPDIVAEEIRRRIPSRV